MATSGSYNTNTISDTDGGKTITRGLNFSWTLSSQSVANNTSTISWTLKGSGGSYGWLTGQNFRQTVNGVTTKKTEKINVRLGTVVLTGTTTITHDAYGKKRFSASSGAELYYYGKENITGSGSWDLPDINRIPNTPTASASSITTSSFVVSWSTNLTTTNISYQVDGGAWVYPGGHGGTSGSFTVTGRSPGKTYSLNIQAQGPGGWSASKALSVRTIDQSTITDIKLSPVFGSNNSLLLTYNSTQTGGTTSYSYSVNSGTWVNTTSKSVTISGLVSGSSTSVTVRAINSNGQITSKSVTGSSYVSPTGSFTLSQSNKKTINVSIGATANTTRVRSRQNTGAWKEITTSTTYSGSPGTKHKIEVELYSSTTGLTTLLAAKEVSLPSLASVTDSSVVSSTRSSADLRLTFSDNVNQIKIRVGTISSKTIDIPNGTSYTLSVTDAGLVSGTSYTIYISAKDSNNGSYNTEQSYVFSTANFRPPTAEKTSTLTTITITYKVQDSCYAYSTQEGSWQPTNLLQSGQTISYKFTKKANGDRFEAGVDHSVDATFLDALKPGSYSLVSTQARTDEAPTIREAKTSGPLTYIDRLYPTISATMSNALYSKRFTITYGNTTTTVNVAAGVNSMSDDMNRAKSEAVMRGTASSTTGTITITAYFTDDGIESPTTSVATVLLPLRGTLINVKTPTAGGITYSAAGGIPLTALVSSRINQASITVPVQDVPLGSTIEKEALVFNGKELAIPTNRVVVISNVDSFAAGRNFSILVRDKRGLENSLPFTVNTFEYKQPSLYVDDISRIGGFGEVLEMLNATISWSVPPSSGAKNSISGLLLKVKEFNTPLCNYGTIIPASSLVGSAPEESKTFARTVINEKTITGLGKVFVNNKPYYLTLVIEDSFGREAIISDILVSSGQALLFIDHKRKQVSVNTTTARGNFEVDGDAYATNIITLSGLVFDKSDIEDI